MTLEIATFLLVAVTFLLAIGTAATAIATFQLARTASREFRVSRLPLLAVRWTNVTRRTGTRGIKVNVKNISRFPIVLHGYEKSVQIRDGSPDVSKFHEIDRILYRHERFPIRFHLGITDDYLMSQVTPLTGLLTLSVTISVFGIGEIRETWTGNCHIRHNPFSKTRRHEFTHDGRHWVREDASHRRTIMRYLETWTETRERWKREMG